MDRPRKLLYKDVRKITGGYYGSRQELMEVSKVESVQVKLWDMKVRAAARVLENGVQDSLIHKAEETRESIGGRSWTAWRGLRSKAHTTI